MKNFILFVILLLVGYKSAEAITDCGHCHTFSPCDHNYTQDCNRCKGFGGELNNNCHVNDSYKGVLSVKLASILKAGKSATNPFKVTNSYILQHSSCSYKGSADDGCRSAPQSDGAVTFNDTSVVSKESDCDSHKLTVHNVDYCLIKLDKNTAHSKLIDFPIDNEDFSDAICARANICDAISWKCNWEYIGCIPLPALPGPPPFTLGYLPSTAFVVPAVGNFKNLATTFQKPIGIVNLIRGNELLDIIKFDLPTSYTPNTKDRYTLCQQYKDGSTEFCAKIDEFNPSQISIAKGSMQLGAYPRPAIEQKKNDISIFPCYNTYVDAQQNNYQGIYAFSINTNKGDAIGITADGRPLYIGPNYLPSLSQDTIGDIRETKCDLCINAASAGDWDNNKIYADGYNGVDGSKIVGCQLNSNIEIKKIKFDNGDDNPLRVDMFDTDEQTDTDPDTNKPIKYYTYNSESALLEGYLAHVTPVIPVIQDKNRGYEADYDIAAISPNNDPTCNSYYKTISNGIMFIKPAGLRNRYYCSRNDKNKSQLGDKDIVTLCADVDSEPVYNSICPGLYQGLADDSQVLPDKICLMSSDDWDFISGRYKNTDQNLNNDHKVVPQMSCTFLPACASLGKDTVPNIGAAIWDIASSFNASVEGKCDEKTYSYKYVIADYGFVNQQDSQQYKNDLDQVKKNIAGKPYMSEDDLTSSLKALYDKDPNALVFTCTKKYPASKCIGGIYGNVPDDTSCVSITNNKKPIKCQPSN